MRSLLAVALVLLLSVAVAPNPVAAAHSGPGTPFSSSPTAANTPAGCANDFANPDGDADVNWLDADDDNAAGSNNAQEACHHMRVDMNALDSPEVDVLLLVPASPTAERDLRIMRQAVHRWEAGIQDLAPRIGLAWLGAGTDFHVTVDTIDPAGAEGGEFTTYPIVDPEVVVIVSNPVGGAGIGIDPRDFTADLYEIVFGSGSGEAIRQGACHGVANPFDLGAWQALPGFDSHHDGRGGTYVEDCGGAGGNVCFAVNGGIDPAPAEAGEVYSLYDLILHEVGHCLSVGHVGDGSEGSWGKLPPNDIMAYSSDPPGVNKCVSTLDVEGFAIRMSRYLDVDGDGAVTPADRLYGNDPRGDALPGDFEPFQTQHPSSHWYEGPTGNPLDCPQPDLATVAVAGVDSPFANDPELRSGQPVEVQTLTLQEDLFYIDVPAGAARLTVELHHKCGAVYAGTGCTNDVDLYTRHGQVPSDAAYACRPFALFTDEVCDHANPAPGRWHIRLFTLVGAGPVTLTATLGGPADSDGDGTNDGEDADRDGDGVPNDAEVAAGRNPDGADAAPTAPDATLCVSKAPGVGDRDGDGVAAVYAKGRPIAVTVGGPGLAGKHPGPSPCWVAGDADDDRRPHGSLLGLPNL